MWTEPPATRQSPRTPSSSLDRWCGSLSVCLHPSSTVHTPCPFLQYGDVMPTIAVEGILCGSLSGEYNLSFSSAGWRSKFFSHTERGGPGHLYCLPRWKRTLVRRWSSRLPDLGKSRIPSPPCRATSTQSTNFKSHDEITIPSVCDTPFYSVGDLGIAIDN